LLIVVLGLVAEHAAQAADFAPRLAFVAYKHDQWDLYSVDETGGDLRQLTDDPYTDDAPAYSPDGTKFAPRSQLGRLHIGPGDRPANAAD